MKILDKSKFNKVARILLLFLGISLLSTLFLSCPIKAATVEDRIEGFVKPKPKPEKVVYLTFDDGPSTYSYELMDLLDEYDVPAIFFVIGENLDLVSDSKEILNEMIKRGHYIGLHSMTHNRNILYYSQNAPQNFVNEMILLKEKISKLTDGFESQLCRAPYGARNHFKKGHYVAVEEAGLTCIDWNIDSLDWSKLSADQIYNQVVSELKHNNYPNETVLLFHEKKLTLQVLPRVVEYFRSLGYEFTAYQEGQEFECCLNKDNDSYKGNHSD